ncbi:hypothetical protein [Desulfosarcina alkanivorans]|jgi:hypothetical protein
MGNTSGITAIYDGNWKNGEPHGRGKMIHSDGQTQDGLWKYGEFQDP